MLIIDINGTWSEIYIKGEKSKYIISTKGVVKNTKTGLILKLSIGKNGYRFASLWHKNNEYREYLHRLLAKAFILNPDPIHKTQVNHIDGNKLNNNLNNLEWCTLIENVQHAARTGLSCRGSKCSNSIYDDYQIHKVCKLLEENKKSPKDIESITGVSSKNIYKILKYHRWSHISCNYNISNYNKFKQFESRKTLTKEIISKIYELIPKYKSNKKICEIIGIEANQKNSSLISWYRKNK